MHTQKTLINAFKATDYDKKEDKVENVLLREQGYGSLAMCALILGLTIYLISIKRRQRFELTILLCMLLKYAMQAFWTTIAFD